MLDDAVLLLAFTNPDGWVARHPQYEDKVQRGDAEVGDRIPGGWDVDPEYGDVESVEDDRVSFGEIGPVGEENDPIELEYFAEAPEGTSATGRYRFGPVLAETEEVSVDFAGTDTNFVVGPST